jgi:hypothetical protein
MKPALSSIPARAIRNAILTTLLTHGGKAKPVDVYASVETQFPRLSRKAQKNLPYNVRWTRKTLLTDGLISNRVRGEWILTAAGLKEARTLLA